VKHADRTVARSLAAALLIFAALAAPGVAAEAAALRPSFNGTWGPDLAHHDRRREVDEPVGDRVSPGEEGLSAGG
jgi:hypothetical protein